MKDMYGWTGEYVYMGLQNQVIKVLEVAPEPLNESDVIELLFNRWPATVQKLTETVLATSVDCR